MKRVAIWTGAILVAVFAGGLLTFAAIQSGMIEVSGNDQPAAVEVSEAPETTTAPTTTVPETTTMPVPVTTVPEGSGAGPFELVELVDEFESPTGEVRLLWYSDDKRHVARLECPQRYRDAGESPLRIEGFITEEFVAGSGRHDTIPLSIQINGSQLWNWSARGDGGNHAIWSTARRLLPLDLQRLYVSVTNYDDDTFLMKFETTAGDWARAQESVC